MFTSCWSHWYQTTVGTSVTSLESNAVQLASDLTDDTGLAAQSCEKVLEDGSLMTTRDSIIKTIIIVVFIITYSFSDYVSYHSLSLSIISQWNYCLIWQLWNMFKSVNMDVHCFLCKEGVSTLMLKSARVFTRSAKAAQGMRGMKGVSPSRVDTA